MEPVEYKKYGFMNGSEELDRVLAHFDIKSVGPYEALESDYTAKADLKIRSKNGKQFHIQLKKLYDLRYNHLLPSLLESFLDSKKHDEEFLLIIKTNKVSNQIIKKVKDFLREYQAEQLNWILIDESSLMRGIYQGKELSEKDQLKSIEHRTRNIDEFKNEIQAISFSPVQQWLLKHLLLNGIQDYPQNTFEREGDWWPYSCNENLADYKVLAKESGVSESSCFNFIKNLIQNDYLEKDKFSYRFKKIDQLFKTWLFSYMKDKRTEVYLEPIKPMNTLESWQNSALDVFYRYTRNSFSRIVMSGHMGTAGAGLSWSNEQSVIFHALSKDSNEFKGLMNELKLRFSEKTNSSIILNLNSMMYPVLQMREDVIKKVGRRDLGIFADPIQLYLDVHLHGARGNEQAEFIYNKILVRHFERWGWRLF
jgi:hypothetical protein